MYHFGFYIALFDPVWYDTIYNLCEVIILKVGEKIKLVREHNNLTRQELAEKIQVTTVTISRYETNKREPNIETLRKIAKSLNVDISELLSIDTEEINNENTQEKGVFHKFANEIDKIELKREINKAEATDMFFKSLGYEIFMPTNEDGDYIFIINDVYYTPSQFETLLKMIESCIENTQNLLRNSED